MKTIIRAVRDGEVCRLIQPVSATGLPKCLHCLKPIPKSYRESWKGKPAWFCTDACPAVIGNLLVYRDSNHMTTTYARALAPVLGRSIGY